MVDEYRTLLTEEKESFAVADDHGAPRHLTDTECLCRCSYGVSLALISVSNLAVCLSLGFTPQQRVVPRCCGAALLGVCGALRQPLGSVDPVGMLSAQRHVVEAVLLSVQHVA